MITYIKKNTPNIYITFEEPLDSESFSNLGTSWDDYLQNKWVPLSEEQVKFHEENPEASVREVWNMELYTPMERERTLEEAKLEKLMEIEEYDNSEDVNNFTINNVIPAWFTPAERTNYALSINSAKLLGQEKLKFPVGANVMEVATEKAELMLSAIHLYADSCYMVTMQHKIAVENLENVEDVDNYDFKSGYPEKLNFNID